MNIGILGTGSIARTMAAEFAKVPAFRCEAVCSRQQATGEALAQQFGIPKVYTDYDAMLADPDIELVYIATPNSLHYAQTKAALLAGKNVLCEKPFVPTVAEADELIALAKEKHLFLFEAITTAHHPNYALAKQYLDDIGSLRIVSCTFCQYSSAASNLMSCLAMQGDDKAMETLLELERNPRPRRKGLYVDPSSYAQIGGWTFDKEGQRIRLGFDTCYPMVKGTTGEKSPVRIGRAREDTCPHCGGRMVDILVLDGRDERLRFLGLDGILTATCCPSCVGFLKGPAFNRFALDGGVEVFPSELFDGAEKTDCYVSPEEYKALTENPFVLGEAPVSLFYGAACQDVNTIGGFANWVQDAEYTTCPHCGKPMKYLAQIQWDTVFDCAEGTLYVEFCPDCQIISMQHQQT